MRNPTTKIGDFTLLPSPDGTCPDYAVAHFPGEPHNQRSMHYQYRFYGLHGRWPTWKDAMAHCGPETQEKWVACLKEHGVTV